MKNHSFLNNNDDNDDNDDDGDVEQKTKYMYISLCSYECSR